MANKYPLINGVYPDFSSIEFKLDGTLIIGLEEISYSHGLESGEVRGTHPQKLGDTLGQYSAEGSLVLFLPEFNVLIRRLGNGWMQKYFNIVVNYRPPGGAMITDKLLGVRCGKAEKSASQGADPIKVTVPLTINNINDNGISPLKRMLP